MLACWDLPGGGLCVLLGHACRAAGRAELERKQQQESDQEREDSERLGHGEAEDEVGELPLRRGRVAQRRREIMSENGTDADAGTAHADAGYAGANHFRSLRVHGEFLSVQSVM